MPAIPRLSKETSIYKPDAIGEGIDGAARTATRYLTESTADGLMVHPSTDSTTGVKVTDSVDVMRAGVSTANFGGTDGSTVRVGRADKGHIVVQDWNISYIYDDVAYASTSGRYLESSGDTESHYLISIPDATGSLGLDWKEYVDWQTKPAYSRVIASAGTGFISVASGYPLAYESEIQLKAERVAARDPFDSTQWLRLGAPSIVEDTDTVSVANSTNTTLASVELPAGTWLVTVSVLFGSSATGRRVVYLSDDASVSSVDVSQDASVLVPAVSGGTTKTSSSAIVTHDATTTYYCRTWQNSGSALSVSAHVKAVRLT